jgi:hypothetical protein
MGNAPFLESPFRPTGSQVKVRPSARKEDFVARGSLIRFSLPLALTAAVAPLVACSSNSSNNGTGDSSTTAPTFTQVYTDIIVGRGCIECHAPADSGAVRHNTLDMSSQSAAYAHLVNVPTMGPACGKDPLIRVTPGDPSKSVMYEKVSEDSPPCGVRMPYGCNMTPPNLGLRCLNTTEQQEVADWITAGAKND